jgi:hypothetical protein
VHATWSEVAERLESLGLKLKLHFEQVKGDDVPRALDKLSADVKGAFEATGNAVQDEAVRAEVREVGLLFADAIAQTLQKAGTQLHDAVSRRT